MFKLLLVYVFLLALVWAQYHDSSTDKHVKVLQAASDTRADGFDYHFETSNGISAAASGDSYGRVHGEFQWISPEGEQVVFSYVADENGYHPKSDFLPTAPPIPAAILKSLQYTESQPSIDLRI